MVKTKQFPKHGTLARQIKFLLNYAILAPSGHNSQPWKFKLDQNSIEILPDFSKSRSVIDPGNRELYISLGAVATNIEVAADYFGMVYQKKYLQDEKPRQLSVVFNFKNGHTISQNQKLFDAITNRSTYRFQFQDKQVSKEIIKDICVSTYPNVKVTPISSRPDKEKLASLVYESNLVWFGKNELVDELETWLRADISKSNDGLPKTSFLRLKTDQEIEVKAQKESLMAHESPLSILISSSTETIENWVNVGEVLEKILLSLTSYGLTNGYFNTPVQLTTMLKKLNQVFKLNGSAQLILRVGYPKEDITRTKRRPLATFIDG